MSTSNNPNIYTFQIGSTRGFGSINRNYNYINARDGGQGPAFFWNNYWSSFRPGPPIPPSPFPPNIYFKYHDTNITQDLYNEINQKITQAENYQNGFIETKNPNYYRFNSDIIVNSPILSNTPKILYAGGFSMLNSVSILNKSHVLDTQGNWDNRYSENDLKIITARAITSTGDIRGGGSIADPTFNLFYDNIPVTFSHPVLISSLSELQFVVNLNNGFVAKPFNFGASPNTKYNEKACIVLNGYFNNKITEGPNAIYPVSIQIIEAYGKKLYCIGPDGLIDMTGQTIQMNNPYVSPPTLLTCILHSYYQPENDIYNNLGETGCGLNKTELLNNGVIFYGNNAQYRFRIFTGPGYSPDGITSLLPDKYENYFFLQYVDPNTGSTTDLMKQNYTYEINGKFVEIVGLAELGVPQTTYDNTYVEDHDNQVDIIVKGDIEIIENIKKLIIPSGTDKNGNPVEPYTNYTKFYNPGGPGPNPPPESENILYCPPSVYQELDVVNHLTNPQTITYIDLTQNSNSVK